MLVREKLLSPPPPFIKGLTDHILVKVVEDYPNQGILNTYKVTKPYNKLRNCTCQSNNLIYCLECNLCHIKYLGQTKNKIIDRYQGHIFDIRHTDSTTVARHFHSHEDQMDPRMTVHILEYIKLPKDIPKSNSLRDKRKLVWIHRLKTLIPNSLNILDWGN